jgi:hypothetical protein
MKTHNFKEKIEIYLKTNPDLSHDEFGILLLIDNLYQESTHDIGEFRKLNTYLDPAKVDNVDDLITFRKIMNSHYSLPELKVVLNDYLNVKYSPQGYPRSFESNMEQFKKDSYQITKILNNLLKVANLPLEIVDLLKESKDLQGLDLLELLYLFKNTHSRLIKFEILRKIGLIDLITRIRKTYLVKEIDFAAKETQKIFAKGLGLVKMDAKPYHLWIDEKDKVHFCNDKRVAEREHKLACVKRNNNAMSEYPLQTFLGKPARTKRGNAIFFMGARNKMKHKGEIDYTSILEKMVRKNVAFPNQIHDVIGLRIITPNADQIPLIISETESFIGGSSSRKKEKNTLHLFGKKKLSAYSSEDYFVWKAIYDVALMSSFVHSSSCLYNTPVVYYD